MRILYITILAISLFSTAKTQTFYLGNDLSYTNQMEDCGATFKQNGVEKNVYQIFADKGTNLVRVRLWYKPTWQNELSQPAGVKNQYSDFDDVKETISRSKAAGMQVMLDLQLTDFWADAGKQLIPAPWIPVASNTSVLSDSVYNYVTKVLTLLNADNLMPEIVKVGNENNGGILQHTILNNDYTVGGNVSNDWSRHALLYNSAIKAIRDISQTTVIKPKIALHYAGLSGLSSWCQNIVSKGVTDFDIIGFSYYYSWHKNSIATLGNVIKSLKLSHPTKDVMVVETGYLWTTQNFDNMGNIINEPDPQYLPVIPEKQLEYMVDYTREVKRAGGIGVVFWEPAWVSTPCRTPWGVGSSQDHVAFFESAKYNFIENGGGNFTNPKYYQDVTTKKVTFKVDVGDQNPANGVFITGKITGNKIVRMARESANIYSYFTYLAPTDSGNYVFLNDSSLTARETVPGSCALWYGTDRKYYGSNADITYGYKWSSCEAAGSSIKFNVTFLVDMTNVSVANGVWLTGSWTGTSWKILSMTNNGNNIFSYSTQMAPGDSGAYYFMNDDVWGVRETVPSACATWWGSDRGYKIGYADTTFAFKWGSCQWFSLDVTLLTKPKISVFPNPSTGNITITLPAMEQSGSVKIIDGVGRVQLNTTITKFQQKINLDLHFLPKGIYLVAVYINHKMVTQTIRLN